jgi:hypothetical protein
MKAYGFDEKSRLLMYIYLMNRCYELFREIKILTLNRYVFFFFLNSYSQ